MLLDAEGAGSIFFPRRPGWRTAGAAGWWCAATYRMPVRISLYNKSIDLRGVAPTPGGIIPIMYASKMERHTRGAERPGRHEVTHGRGCSRGGNGLSDHSRFLRAAAARMAFDRRAWAAAGAPWDRPRVFPVASASSPARGKSAVWRAARAGLSISSQLLSVALRVKGAHLGSGTYCERLALTGGTGFDCPARMLASSAGDHPLTKSVAPEAVEALLEEFPRKLETWRSDLPAP